MKIGKWDEQTLGGHGGVVPDNLSIPEDEGLRVVNIQGAGAYPCGGTHVRDTSYWKY